MPCLCAPTSHEGSFRCRLHRGGGLNLITNPAQSIVNHQSKEVNFCTNSFNEICVCESSASAPASASTAPHPLDDHARSFSHTPQVAVDHQNSMRSRPSTSPWSSSSSYRSSSSSPSSLYTSSSSSSSRASTSSSSLYMCARPPPAKRSSSSSSSLSKSPYRASSSPSPSCANGTSPSASHAAALAIMKQHSHNKHGARIHNRNILSPTSPSKIGPSRLSRMAVACADELPLKDEQCVISNRPCISNSPRHGSALDTFSGSFAETAAPRGFTSFEAAPIGLKARSAANKFKQSESSCRIVGSKEGSLIMPTVY